MPPERHRTAHLEHDSGDEREQTRVVVARDAAKPEVVDGGDAERDADQTERQRQAPMGGSQG